MLKSMKQYLVGLVMFAAMPDVLGSALKYHFDKDHVKSWQEEGKKAGTFTRDAFATAETAVMKMLLNIAAIIAGTPSVEDFLTGYATAWSNSDTAKSRKTDARAVLEAYGRKDADGKPFEYEKVVGVEKDKDGKIVDDPVTKSPKVIRQTKAAKAWLDEYEGDFKGFLALAREIKNAGSGRQSQGTVLGTTQATAPDHRAKKKVTEKQFAAIMENIPVASAAQAHTLAVEATKQMVKMPEAPILILNQMEMLCNEMKAIKNVDPIYLNFVGEVIDLLNGLRDEVRKAKDADEKLRREAMEQKNATVVAGALATQDAQAAALAASQQTAPAPKPEVQGDQQSSTIEAPAPAEAEKTGTHG